MKSRGLPYGFCSVVVLLIILSTSAWAAEPATKGGPDFIMEAIKRSEDIGVPLLKELGLYVEK